jgi:hypothetical protein
MALGTHIHHTRLNSLELDRRIEDTEVCIPYAIHGDLISSSRISLLPSYYLCIFFFGATAPLWALAYLHETLRFTSVY